MNNTVMIAECLKDFIHENEISLNESYAFEFIRSIFLTKKLI